MLFLKVSRTEGVAIWENAGPIRQLVRQRYIHRVSGTYKRWTQLLSFAVAVTPMRARSQVNTLFSHRFLSKLSAVR